MKRNTSLETAIINTFRSGHVVTISQLMGIVQSTYAEHRSTSTPEFRTIVFRLEKDKILRREKDDGITRFSYGAVKIHTAENLIDEEMRQAVNDCVVSFDLYWRAVKDRLPGQTRAEHARAQRGARARIAEILNARATYDEPTGGDDGATG